MTILDMSKIAKDYRELQAMIKQLEEEADALKRAMIKEMDASRVDKNISS